MPTYAFELLNESSNFLEFASFCGQVLWVERTHLGQDGIELRAIVTSKFPLE